MEMDGVVDSGTSRTEQQHSARKSVLALLTAIVDDDLEKKERDEAAKLEAKLSGGQRY